MPNDIQAVMGRKLYGVPVPIIALVGIGGAYWLFKNMGTATTPADTATTDTPSGDANATSQPTFSAADVSSAEQMAANIQASNTAAENAALAATMETNVQWSQKAVSWLVQNKSIPVTVAQAAVDKYLSGGILTTEESNALQLAVASIGAPPEGVTPGSSVGITPPTPTTPSTPKTPTPATPAPSAPAVRQGNPVVGAFWHVVKGSNDNSWTELAKLYFPSHNQVDARSLMRLYNPGGKAAASTFSIGTRIYVPKWHAKKTYKVNSATRAAASIAAKNNLTLEKLQALNYEPHIVMSGNLPIGKVVRVW